LGGENGDSVNPSIKRSVVLERENPREGRNKCLTLCGAEKKLPDLVSEKGGGITGWYKSKKIINKKEIAPVLDLIATLTKPNRGGLGKEPEQPPMMQEYLGGSYSSMSKAAERALFGRRKGGIQGRIT